MPPQQEDPLLSQEARYESCDAEDPLLPPPGPEERKADRATMEGLDPYEKVRRPSVYRRESFLVQFVQSKGPPQIIILIMLLALGFGSTIGVVPAVMTDRYARLQHGYMDERDCADFETLIEKPAECLQGSADAQNAAALSSLVSNVLTFITSSLMGSISDEHGRRGILILGLALNSMSPLCLVLLQFYPEMSPTWYYVAHACTGLVSWIAMTLSSLADVMPPKWRAPSFGLVLAGFSVGFALAPTLALAFDHFQISILSCAMILAGLLVSIVFFPETLPERTQMEAIERRLALSDEVTGGWFGQLCFALKRPIREISILNRSRFFRLLSSLAFFSGMVSSADQTLLIYYVEERLQFNDHDVALMFMIMGLLGILVQAVLLKPLNDWIGERWVIVLAFSLGSLDNVLYGLARKKGLVFFAVSLSAFAGLSFPTISAIKSNNVQESEQGRIQGALYSLQALASGTGPMLLRFVYSQTKDLPYPGAGWMFIFAGLLYLVAVACAWALPKEKANSNYPSDASSHRLSRSDFEPLDSIHEDDD